MDNSTVMQMGEVAEGFMGVMPYRYYYDTERTGADAREDPRDAPSSTRTAYIQGFLSAMLFAESARRTLTAGKMTRQKPQGRAQHHQDSRISTPAA